MSGIKFESYIIREDELNYVGAVPSRCPVQKIGHWRNIWNNEIYGLYKDLNCRG